MLAERPTTIRRGAEPAPGRRFPPRERTSGGAATLALAGLTLASVAGLARVFATDSWIGPVVATATGTHLACWASRRLRLPQAVSAAASLAGACLLSIWTVVPSATLAGLPDLTTLHALGRALSQARIDLTTVIAPAPATTGFTLLAAWGAGVAAFLGDWGAFRLRSVLYAMAAPFALFVSCCVLGGIAGRGWASAVWVAAALAFLLVHRSAFERYGAVWLGGQRTSAARWAGRVGAGSAAVALVGAALVTPVLPHYEGRGVFGWRAGPGSGGYDRQVANPIVDLHTRKLQLADTPVFTVRSPVASYWRLTSLDTFTGQQWVSTDSYRGFSRTLPGIQAVPKGTRLVVEQFHVQALDSVWLPDAFTPETVTGLKGVSYDPVSGSLLASSPTADGLSYQVTAYQYLSTLDGADLAVAPKVTITSSLRRYLRLPSSVPPSIAALARRLTAGYTTEYGKALALQNYFQSSAFTYSLAPPDDGYGMNALTTFLFRTRTGYCQQFAGAYAVLARSAGLPTRLAVGFTAGAYLGNDTYQVSDANAHTWPEVYFGPKYGWLPFEPTKNEDIPSATGYTGTPARSNSSGPLAVAPKPGVQAGTAPGSAGTSASTIAPPGLASLATLHRANRALRILALLAALAAACGLWALLNSTARRARWRARRRSASRPGTADPAAGLILAHWEEAAELLAWWQIRRYPSETNTEFSRRAERALTVRLGDRVWVPPLDPLAELAGEASFAATTDPNRVSEARGHTDELRAVLRMGATWRQRFSWWMNPLLAWRAASRPAGP